MMWHSVCPCGIPQPRLDKGERLRDFSDADIIDFVEMTQAHGHVHKHRLCMQQATGQLPERYPARERAKSEGRDLMWSGAPLADRLRGSNLFFHGYYHRSLEVTAHSGRDNHPSFDVYVGALPVEQIVPPDLVGPVRARYPKNTSIFLEPTKWIWVP